MIDFRYHLISIVAVFLALGIGILMGSYVLGEGLVNQLRREFGVLKDDNDQLQTRVTDLEEDLDNSNAFTSRIADWMLPGRLTGRSVVLFDFQGTDGGVEDAISTAVEEAGGRIASTITVDEDLALPSPAARDQLALILSSAETNGNVLRAELGRRLAEAATTGAGIRGQEPDAVEGSNRDDLAALVADLVEAGFVSVDGPDGDEQVVPPGSWFVVLGGGEADPPFRLAEFTMGLTIGLADSEAPVVVAESSSSDWGLATMVRVDDDAQNLVATNDEADTDRGSLAVVLALERAADGAIYHSGVKSGAGGVLPDPAPTP